MRVGELSPGTHPRERRLIEQRRRQNLGVVRVDVCAARRRWRGERWIHARLAEADFVRGRAVYRTVQPIAPAVEGVIDSRRPLQTVAWRRFVPGADPDHWKVAGNRPDRRSNRRRTGAGCVEELPGRAQVAVRREGGRKRVGDERRHVARPVLLHEPREVGGDDRRIPADRDAGAEHVTRSEEERAVPHERPADSPGELLAAEVRRRPLELVFGLEVVVRVVVAAGAVQVVGSALGDDVDEHRAVPAILGREVVDRDANFLDALRVRVDVDDAAALTRAHRRRVDQEIVGLGARAVRVHVHTELVAVEVRAGLRIGLRAARRPAEHARGEHDQTEKVAAGEREVLDLTLLDESRHAALRGFNQRRGRLHRHLLGRRADGHLKVDGSCLGDLQLDLILDDGPESLQGDADGIETVAERREPIISSLVRGDVLHRAGLLVGQRHRGGRHHAPARIADGAFDGAGKLGVGARDADEEDRQEESSSARTW